MTLNLTLAPIVSVIAGILILIMPRLLNYIVALYLIIIGCIGIFGVNLQSHYVPSRSVISGRQILASPSIEDPVSREIVRTVCT